MTPKFKKINVEIYKPGKSTLGKKIKFKEYKY